MQKNAKNGTFFYKERKRTQRTERSFIKNAKERKERNVLLKRTDAQPCGVSCNCTACSPPNSPTHPLGSPTDKY